MEPQEKPVNHLLHDYYYSQCLKFSASFLACQNSFNRKNIHDLRLALKNLHSFFLLLNLLNIQRKRKPLFPEQLEKLFDNLGKIRDLQIMDQELSTHEKALNTFFDKLKSKIKRRQSERTRDIMPLLKNLKFGIELNRIKAYLREVVSLYEDEKSLFETIRSHLLKTWKQIRIQLKHKHTRKNLHLIRIRIKHLGYMTLVVKKEEPLIRELPFRIEMLDEFQELLGSWHDQVVFYNKILDEMKDEQNKHRMKIYFLLGSIRKKRGRMSRKVSFYCARILKQSTGVEKPGKPVEI